MFVEQQESMMRGEQLDKGITELLARETTLLEKESLLKMDGAAPPNRRRTT
jgi:hypothetical protein